MEIREEADVSAELDVRALNSAPPAFQFRVIQKGVVLYESSPGERADVEVKIARTYHDLKPRLEEHWELRKERVIESG